jgi:transposase-like protein
MMANKKQQPRPETVEKERQILELRRAGMSYADIAQSLGIASAAAAREAFRRAMQHSLSESGADELREIESERLDRLQRAAWPKAANGDLSAIAMVLRIMERRSKLLGLDRAAADDEVVEVQKPVESQVDRAARLRAERRQKLRAV